MKQSLLVVGLGNPGTEYSNTRHNVGFNALDRLANELSVSLAPQKSCNALVAKANFSTTMSYVLAAPITFMNRSGLAVASLLKWYEIDPRHCIVITDNVDLPVGSIKAKSKGSGGTHNGIRSVHAHLQSFECGLEYTRIYIGVGSARSSQALSSYVLSKWHGSEDLSYQHSFDTVANAILESVPKYFDSNTKNAAKASQNSKLSLQEILATYFATHSQATNNG